MNSHLPRARRIALSLFFAAFLSCVHAEPAPLDEVVITATRVPASVSALSASVEVLTREDIERSQAASLADVLRGVAGFESARNGGPGTTTSFFLRGHNSINLVLMIDGVRAPVDGFGNPLVADIALAHVERIEILRGDASALYGGAANGGVIHIITRKGAGQYAMLGVGGQGRRSSQAALTQSLGGTEVAIRLGREQSGRLSAMNVAQKPAANPDQDRSTIDNMTLHLVHQLDTNHKFRLSVSQVIADIEYDDDDFGSGNTHDTHDLKRKTAGAALVLTSRLSPRWRSEIALSQSRQTQEDRKNGALKTSAYAFGRASSDQLGLRWVNQLAVTDRSILLLGLEVTEEKFHSDATSSGFRLKKDDGALLAGLSHEQGDWALQVNLRRDWLATQDQNTSRQGSEERNSALLGVSYRLSPVWKMLAQVSSGFRAASVGEQTYASGPLRAESFDHRELALAYKQSAHQLRLGYFWVDMKDLIAYDRSSNLTNLQARNRGLELSGRSRWGSTDIRLGLTVQDPENLETGKALLRRSKRQASLKFLQPLGGGTEWSAALNYHGQRKDFGERLLGSYGLLDIGASYALGPKARLRVSLDNVTDRIYQTAYGYNAPRRGVFAAMNLQAP
ncbi:MAG: TonB-dependent receptor [Betaproteobacteria bacterium]|nr:TonB-dependent receptor [Betaproteobacteria bacterium]